MSALAQRAEQYRRLRRALGHQLDDAHRLLPRFVAYLDSLGASRIPRSAFPHTSQGTGTGGAAVVRSVRAGRAVTGRTECERGT